MQETEKIWMNGELVDWADAKVHVGVHGLHYGSGVFEGIRCYETADGPAVFRLTEHLVRLHNSGRLLGMEVPYGVDELRSACLELIGANGLPECYLRPICFYGYGQLGVAARENPVETVIMSWPWGAYLGEEGMKRGIRAKISSWQRIGPNVSVIEIARDLGYTVEERNLIRSDLYLADEVFMCGTAAEVTPLRTIDDYEIGVGPITLELQQAYLDACKGRSERWDHWLERAELRAAAEA